MAGIWYNENNSSGRLESPAISYTDDQWFDVNSSSRELHYYTKMQLSSASVGSENIDLLTIINPDNPAYISRLFINTSGQIEFQNKVSTTIRGSGYTASPLPTDALVELTVAINPNRGSYDEKIMVWFNGVNQTVESIYLHNFLIIWNDSCQLFLGSYQTSQPKEMLILNGQAANEWQNSALPITTGRTLWSWDFEDSSRPLEIKVTRENDAKTSLDWINTDPANIVWTEGNAPPGGDTGGNGGGIIIPGNGNTTRVSGTITEDGVPVARRVFAMTEAQLEMDGSDETVHAVLDSTYSDAVSGDYTLDTSPYEGAVMVMAMDAYGTLWQADTAYNTGDVIRPADYQGYVYHCTTAGTSSSTEPTWWFDTNTSQNIGTALFKAKPYARPLAHGPIIPDIIVE